MQKVLKKPRGWDDNVLGQSILAMRKLNPPDYFDSLKMLLQSEDVREPVKLNFVIPVMNEIDSIKAQPYVLAYQIAKTKGEKLEDVVRQLINSVKDK